MSRHIIERKHWNVLNIPQVPRLDQPENVSLDKVNRIMFLKGAKKAYISAKNGIDWWTGKVAPPQDLWIEFDGYEKSVPMLLEGIKICFPDIDMWYKGKRI